MPISEYAIRRAVGFPRACYLRRTNKHLELQPLLEHFSYSRPFYDFLQARRANPDLIVDFDIDAQSTVVDVGAFVGEWSARISERSRSRVYAFEPNPAPQPRLRRRLAGYPNVTVLEYGLGARDETVELSLQGPGSSIFNDSPRFESTSIAIRDAALTFEDLRLDDIHLLKLNIEGSEYDVLERLIASHWMPRIGVLLVQFHEWIPKAHSRRRAIQRELSKTHTKLWDYPWIWEAWCHN
jgi:FkbM family methyltransferase